MTVDDAFEFAQHRCYSPARLRRLLPSLRHYVVPGTAFDPAAVLRSGQRRGEWVEERLIESADLLRALAQLPWFTRHCVIHAYVYHRFDEDIAEIEDCDRETVKRRRLDGVATMARYLGWEEPPERRTPSPTIWVHPSLARDDE